MICHIAHAKADCNYFAKKRFFYLIKWIIYWLENNRKIEPHDLLLPLARNLSNILQWRINLSLLNQCFLFCVFCFFSVLDINDRQIIWKRKLPFLFISWSCSIETTIGSNLYHYCFHQNLLQTRNQKAIKK